MGIPSAGAMRSVVRHVGLQARAQRRRVLAPAVRTQNTLSLESNDADVDPRRQTVPLFGKAPVISPDAFVAPSATVIGQVELHDKTGVWYNAVLRGDMNPISVGYASHVMDGSVVCVDSSLAAGHDSSTVIGQFVNVGARCYLKACTVQDHVTIGDGCIVQEGALIEARAVLEPGSVVPAGARIPGGELWGGNPVAFVRKLDRSELDKPEYKSKALHMLGEEHQAEFLPHGSAYQDLK